MKVNNDIQSELDYMIRVDQNLSVKLDFRNKQLQKTKLQVGSLLMDDIVDNQLQEQIELPKQIFRNQTQANLRPTSPLRAKRSKSP